MKKMKQNYLKVKHLKFQNLVASFPEQLLQPCIFSSLEMSYILPLLKFPNFQHDLLFFIKYQEDLVCLILSFSSQPHILSTELAASWPQVWIFCIFEEIIFPQSWRTSFQLEYQTVKFHCTFVYTSISLFQSQKIIAITI